MVEFLSRRLHWILPLALCALAAGCGGDRAAFTGTRRIDEKVTVAELAAFVRVVRSLPDDRLPEMPPVFAPPPDWNLARTLPVGELVNEEQNRISERWSPEWLARRLEKNRTLARALRREQMSTQQFVGLTLALGVALARNTLNDTDDFHKILGRGRVALERLQSDSRPFSSLRREGKHHVLQQAAWITRIDRIRRLMQVPPENRALVQDHLDVLGPMFPAEFNNNPLDAVVDRLEEQGLPFAETSDSGSDAQIEWDPQEALIGTDPPDEESREPEVSAGLLEVNRP